MAARSFIVFLVTVAAVILARFVLDLLNDFGSIDGLWVLFR